MVFFNHERLWILNSGIRSYRVLVNESMRFTNKKEKPFGKKLIEHPAIREKLAHKIKNIEAT